MRRPETEFHFEYEFKGISAKTGEDTVVTGSICTETYSEFLTLLHAAVISPLTEQFWMKK